MGRCQCRKIDGKQCKRDPKKGSNYCWQHQNCTKQKAEIKSKQKAEIESKQKAVKQAKQKAEKQAKQKVEKQAQQKAEKQAKQASDKLEELPITPNIQRGSLEDTLISPKKEDEIELYEELMTAKFFDVPKLRFFAQFLAENGYTASELKKFPVEWEKSIDPVSVKFNQILKKFKHHVKTVEKNEEEIYSELWSNPKFTDTGDRQDLAHLLAINGYTVKYLKKIPKNWRRAHDPISVDFQKALEDDNYLFHDPENLWEWHYDYGEKYW